MYADSIPANQMINETSDFITHGIITFLLSSSTGVMMLLILLVVPELTQHTAVHDYY
jgi:hypothetical protein